MVMPKVAPPLDHLVASTVAGAIDEKLGTPEEAAPALGRCCLVERNVGEEFWLMPHEAVGMDHRPWPEPHVRRLAGRP